MSPGKEKKPFWQRFRNSLLVGATVAMAGTGLVSSAAYAATGGGGTSGGAGGGGTTNSITYIGDDADIRPPYQGTGLASIQYARDRLASQGYVFQDTGQSWPSEVVPACTEALTEASQRGGYGDDISKSRVVLISMGVRNDGFGYYIPGVDWPNFNTNFQNAWNQINNNLENYSNNEKQAVYNQAMHEINEINPYSPRAICVALNDQEPHPPNYNLSISTDKSGTFNLSGGTQTVLDVVTAVENPVQSSHETLSATFTLKFQGLTGADPATASGQKKGNITSSGKSNSPGFTPSDLGMTTWAPGKYWFDVSVAKQGRMAAAVSHAGVNDSRENWSPRFALSVATDAQNKVEISGGTQAVYDRITTTAPGYTGQMTVAGKVTLNWDGKPSTTTSKKSATKDVNINIGTNNVTNTPEFIPSDFGWTQWPAGRMWYDVTVAAQNGMNAAVDTPDRDPRETWIPKPPPPTKVVAKPGTTTDMGSSPSVASGQTVDIRISANASGTEKFWIKDIVKDGRVHLGATGETSQAATATDVPAGIYVVGPDGQRLSASQYKISIAPAAPAARVVTAEITKAPGQEILPLGNYTLVVPTTPLPTATDYVFADNGRACWDGESEDCQDTPEKTPEKETPEPDKSWGLTEDGSLTLNDPDWSNNVGADGKTFLSGDTVYATVVDHIYNNDNKPLDLPLNSYEIQDNWAEAVPYIDFNRPELAKVWWKELGESEYTDVTSDFDIVIDPVKGTTTGVAKKDSAFLKATGKPGKGGNVRLTIGGVFLPELDTEGNKIVIHNAGHSKWNNETRPTNEPPVYIWNPIPDKDVLGEPENGGKDESINGQMVFPGQLIKYQVKLDTHLPEGMAYDVTKFGMIDYYDKNFEPQRESIEVTGRNGVVPKSNYTVTWNDDDPENSYFELLFKQDWISDYLKEYAYETDGKPVSDQDGRRYLTVTFKGLVKADTANGTVVKNKAVQLINNSIIPTPEPEVTIPPTEPDKEDLRCTYNKETGQYENCADIDGKVVMKGDKIDYRLLMDARPASSKFAYLVHKLGMVDDFDDEYLSLKPEDIQVTVASVGSDAADKFMVGQNVTDQFNVSVEDGQAYIFAKTVDTPNPVEEGKIIPGNPQPESLAAYHNAPINPLTDPAIDQDLLGNTYWIYLRTTVEKETDGYVIENQAVQNFNNKHTPTKVVTNPLKELKPEKDVNVLIGEGSVNGKEIPLNSVFNYALKSSTIPANRAYETTAWNIVDDYNEAADQYTGQYAIVTNTDIYDGDKLVAKAGDIIASSKGAALVNKPSAVDDFMARVTALLGTNTVSKITEVLGEDGTAKVTAVVQSLLDGKTKPAGFFSEIEKSIGAEKVAQIKKDLGALKLVQLEILVKNANVIVDQFKAEEAESNVNAETKPEVTEDTKDESEETKPEETEEKPTEEGETTENAIPAFQDSFTVVNKDGVLTVTALKDSYFDTINTRLDLEQGWTSYVQFTRIAPGDITNTFVENYNDIPREPEEVITHTPENPAISVVKYDTESGLEKGDRNDAKDALTIKKGGEVKISFLITNTGDVPLKDITLVDKTVEGSGTVKDITCEPTLDGLILQPKETTLCEGTLTGVKAGETHTDNATVTGKSVYTDKEVTDEDPWNGKVDPDPVVPPKGAITGEAMTTINMLMVIFGALIISGGVAGSAYMIRRRKTEDA